MRSEASGGKAALPGPVPTSPAPCQPHRGEGAGKWPKQLRRWKQLAAGRREVSGCSTSLIAREDYPLDTAAPHARSSALPGYMVLLVLCLCCRKETNQPCCFPFCALERGGSSFPGRKGRPREKTLAWDLEGLSSFLPLPQMARVTPSTSVNFHVLSLLQ